MQITDDGISSEEEAKKCAAMGHANLRVLRETLGSQRIIAKRTLRIIGRITFILIGALVAALRSQPPESFKEEASSQQTLPSSLLPTIIIRKETDRHEFVMTLINNNERRIKWVIMPTTEDRNTEELSQTPMATGAFVEHFEATRFRNYLK